MTLLAAVLSLLKAIALAFVRSDVSREAEYQLCQEGYCSLFMNAANSFTLTREYYARDSGVIVLRKGYEGNAAEGTEDSAPEKDTAAYEGDLLLSAGPKKAAPIWRRRIRIPGSPSVSWNSSTNEISGFLRILNSQKGKRFSLKLAGSFLFMPPMFT